MNELFPIFMKMEQFQTLVVGAGNVGLEKVSAILNNSPKANITIVAPMVRPELLEFIKDFEQVKVVQEPYSIDYLANKQLVLVATDNKVLNQQIKKDAAWNNILCNVADTPNECDFYLGSVVQKGSLKLGISTNGKSPTVAKRIKDVLNETFPDELESLLDNVGQIRKKLTGDFAQKIVALNQLTQQLKVEKDKVVMDKNEIAFLETEIEGKNLVESLQYLVKRFGKKVAFSTSLGQEDQVIINAIYKNEIDIRIFTLDTGRLFQETYELIDKNRLKYKKSVETYFPDAGSVQTLMNTKGANSFYESVENRKECCFIRKVEPLNRALAGVGIWITGLRADQSEGRNDLSAFEWDEARQIIKFNPLVNWSYEQVLDYLKTNKVFDNPLHKKGFVSIGCQPCTRAIAEGEHPRAGRWWWEESKKECGLHG